MTQLHFISGLPRSGSTLLAGILRQNPDVYAAMSSQLAMTFNAALSAMSSRNEFSMFIEPIQREHVLRGILENFYFRKTSAEIVFDTSRAWCARVGAITALLPESKTICCVRNAAWILDSIERLVQANPIDESKMFFPPSTQQGPPPGITVYSRMDQLMGKGGMVSSCLDALREAYYGPHTDRILLVRYESLAGKPAATMDSIYDFIQVKRFAHDFDNVDYQADEFDRLLGMPGLHTVRRKVELIDRQMIIPPDIAARFNIDFWNDEKANLRKVRVI